MKLFPIALMPALLVITWSCGSSPVPKNDTETSSSATANQSTVSCMLDGKPYSVSAPASASHVSLQEDKVINGYVFQVGHVGAHKEGFTFEINDKGETKVGSDFKYVCNYFTPTGIVFLGKGITVTITSTSGMRLKGTFSGIVKNAGYGDGWDKLPATMQVTEGKFDIFL